METSVRRCGLMSSIAVVEETRSVEVFSLDVVHKVMELLDAETIRFVTSDGVAILDIY